MSFSLRGRPAILAALTALLAWADTVKGQPFTEPGIPASSPSFVGWATSVFDIQRGPQNISVPGSPPASFGDPLTALGVATGNPNSVVSLGDGGRITLGFGPLRLVNGPGADFAVFENGFVSGSQLFAELGHVEVSTDGVTFVRFPSVSLTQTTTQINGTLDPTNVHNLAGKHAALFGTPFDLNELAGSRGLDVNDVRYVRVVDVVGSINPLFGTRDALGHLINDPFPTGFPTGGFDLDAVGVINAVPEPSSLALSGLAAAAAVHSAFRKWRRPRN
jgi:PEP-CTERM motif